MQRMGASFIAKKLADQILTDPKASTPVEATGEQVVQASETVPGIDGEMILDEDGSMLGPARRLADLAVYVVPTGQGTLTEDLAVCLDDPDSRIFTHTLEGKLAGLIFIPAVERLPREIDALRSDDI